MIKKIKADVSIWLFLLFLLIAIGITWLFHPQIQEFIISPLSISVQYFLWVIDIIKRSLDQLLIWGTFLIIAIISVIVNLSKTNKQHLAQRNYLQNSGNIRRWITRLESINRGPYFKWRLSQHLAPILLQTIAMKQGLTINQAQILLKKGELDTHSDMLRYMQAAYSEDSFLFFSSNNPGEEISFQLNKPVIEIVDYLNNQLFSNDYHWRY